jgi:hypothetical protein
LNIVPNWVTNEVLTNLLRKRAIRLPIAAIAALGWVAVSNHCALAAVEGAVKLPMPSCHGTPASHQVPAKSGQSGVECCKTLRATLLTLSKQTVAFDESQFTAVAYLAVFLPVQTTTSLIRPLELDTGPPFAHSFAESVLQRSLLSHAPPLSLS